jgi:uncharacterized repeat protein (TIGR03837 family)
MTETNNQPYSPSVDLFCKVIDNYGDIGVCLRLARQLAREYGLAVRLFVDDLKPLIRLEPRAKNATKQILDGVEIWRWDAEFSAADYSRPSDIVIEAFACDLPGGVVAAMKARIPRPVWINLEYLSAEDWVDEFHAIPSVHPETGLTKTAFFPGFTAKTGGLLRERDVISSITPPSPSSGAALAPLSREGRGGLSEAKSGEVGRGKSGLTVSLFCYAYAPVAELLRQTEASPVSVTLLIPEGVVSDVPEGTRGKLTIRRIPFLPQADYDHFLKSCDVNFVRGEDSFLRAQFSAKPLIWNIYAQGEDAHIPKLQAFLKRYSTKLSHPCAQTLADFHAMWNQGGRAKGSEWSDLVSCLPELTSHAVRWMEEIGGRESLADLLLRFARKQTENQKVKI